MTPSKTRKVLMVDHTTGTKTESALDVPCTVHQHISAVNLLNSSAHLYGVTYVVIDEESLAYMKGTDKEST